MELLKKLLYPPLWLTALLVIACAAALTAVFVGGWEEHPVAYAVYVLSFYTLCAVTALCVRVLPGKYRLAREKVYEHPFGNRYMTDRAFRAQVSLYSSLGINMLYVLLNLLSWLLYRSWWFVVLAGYYGILSLMRFLLAGYIRGNDIGGSLRREWKRSRICAWILLLLNLSLSAAVLMILYLDRGYTYGGMLIYVMAGYTFYSTIHAVVDMVKYRALGSPVVSTAKIISLCAALVSVLNLETAMFSQFGESMAQEDQRLMIVLTGAGVSIVVVTLSVLLIVRASRELRSEK